MKRRKKAKNQAKHQQSQASSLVKLQELFTKIRNTVQETMCRGKSSNIIRYMLPSRGWRLDDFSLQSDKWVNLTFNYYRQR